MGIGGDSRLVYHCNWSPPSGVSLGPHVTPHLHIRMTRSLIATLGLLALPALLPAQRGNPAKLAPRPTTGAIVPADLMTRVYIFADDSMMGRESGTVYHDKGTDYIARELTRLGLRPAGDNGTFFQRLPIVERTLSPDARLTVDGRAFEPWRDFLPRDNGGRVAPIQNASVVYAGVFGDTSGMIGPAQAAGKVIVFTVARGFVTNRPMLLARYANAAGIAIAALDSIPREVVQQFSQPQVGMSGGELPAGRVLLHQRSDDRSDVRATDRGAHGRRGRQDDHRHVEFRRASLAGLAQRRRDSPGQRSEAERPVRGDRRAQRSRGTRPGRSTTTRCTRSITSCEKKAPTTATSRRRPRIGPRCRRCSTACASCVRARLDSIFNGADDDASGSMGMLEVAEAFATAREKPTTFDPVRVARRPRSRACFGASYFTDHPTVPRDSIVAQINIDMIGRGSAADTPGGGPGYVQLIGSRRLSTQLGDLVEAEGKKSKPPFRFDYSTTRTAIRSSTTAAAIITGTLGTGSPWCSCPPVGTRSTIRSRTSRSTSTTTSSRAWRNSCSTSRWPCREPGSTPGGGQAEAGSARAVRAIVRLEYGDWRMAFAVCAKHQTPNPNSKPQTPNAITTHSALATT